MMAVLSGRRWGAEANSGPSPVQLGAANWGVGELMTLSPGGRGLHSDTSNPVDLSIFRIASMGRRGDEVNKGREKGISALRKKSMMQENS
jgi:hypothetical protein